MTTSATSLTQGIIRIENLAVVTSNGEVSPWQVKELIQKKWELFSQELENGTILFIAGAHGTKDGKLVEKTENGRDILNVVDKDVVEKESLNFLIYLP